MYILTGYDSAGERHEYTVDDTGAITGAGPGSAMFTAWLGENPFEKPEPIEGETVPESGAMTPSQVEALRQHVSKLLTLVQLVPQPLEDETPTDPEAPIDTRATRAPAPPAPVHTPAPRPTTAELEAMTVTDLRSLAHAAQIAGASSMSKAELVTALSAPRHGTSER